MSTGFSVASRKSEGGRRARRRVSKNPLNFDEGSWFAAFCENGGPQYFVFLILAFGGTIFCSLSVYNVDGHLHFLWLMTILFWFACAHGVFRLIAWLIRVPSR